MHGLGEPSDWVRRWASLITPGGRVLDLACGGGRHLRWLAAQGFATTGVDRDAQALATLQGVGELITADLENGPWPLAGRQFDAVIITNYLWRPTVPQVVALLAEGAVLIHETFADGHQALGKPSRPEFLLRTGELLSLYTGLRVVAFEDGYRDDPPRFVQRIAAVRAPAGPGRYALRAAG